MLELYLRYFVRPGALKEFQQWKLTVLENLIKLFPKDTPYHYDVSPSFLLGPEGIRSPVKIDLIFPDIPLFVQVLPVYGVAEYPSSRNLLSRPEWEALLEQTSSTTQTLRQVLCPHLVIIPSQATDVSSLRERLHLLLGKSP